MIRRFQICKDLADEHSDIKKEPKAELVVLFKIATRYKINIKKLVVFIYTNKLSENNPIYNFIKKDKIPGKNLTNKVKDL